MRYIILLLATAAIIIACNTGSKTKGSFKPGNLETSQFVINIDRDTTIQTKNGALLKIPKGALSTDDAKTVTLEIKEAYNFQQMIQAGLTTQSNGEPLSSGGMIYINAAAGQNVKITQKIQVAIPSNYSQKDMQLFKGEEDNDNLNWTDPQPLPPGRFQPVIDTGKLLFERNCASCHAIEKDMTGPALAHYIKRFENRVGEGFYIDFWGDNHYISNQIAYRRSDSMNNITSKQYYSNNEAFRVYEEKLEQDRQKTIKWHHRLSLLYSCNLSKIYGSYGPPFHLSHEQFYSIYRYIQNESDRRSLPMPDNSLFNCADDSCYQYEKQVRELNELKQLSKSEREQLIKENNSLVTRQDGISQSPTTVPDGPIEAPVYEDKVTPENYEAVYYEFTIETFGWYNIDILMKNINGVEESTLFVRIAGQYREKIKVYLIIPNMKVYVEGGRTGKNDDEYAFDKKDGKINLPQGAEAFILAMSESEESASVIYTVKKFTTSTQQEFSMELAMATKEQFNEAMNRLTPAGMNVKVKDSKNAAQIRETAVTLKEIDAKLKDAEKLKPKGCDCNCSQARPATADSVAVAPIYFQ